ncbi:MAG: BrnT family toxin [Phycisphaerae bacterium]
MRFDWNTRKADANRRKHRVSFDEACTIFADRSILTIHDAGHSAHQDRWVSMAMSSVGRVLVVVHTWPEPDQTGDELVRIISARRANKQEQRVYLDRER